jgi:hypothetical protein
MDDRMFQSMSLESARQELLQKSLADIQRDTAFTWCDRACAAYGFAEQSTGPARFRWAADGLEYEHEAVERAALCDDMGVLFEVRARIAQAKGL